MESTTTLNDSESIDDVFLHTGVSEENENEVASSFRPTRDDVNIVDSEKIPYFGMNFTNLEGAKQFYIDYGKSLGFSAVTRSTQKRISYSDEVSTCQMTYKRFGTYIERVKKRTDERSKKKVGSEKEVINKRRNTNTVKCGCLATMRVTKQDSGLWKVVKYVGAHNHNLVTPAKR
ncbi:hypothetical protein IFM89_020152 [Coptis chinensis]|uniref:FAR1 domain-containing protein n=1 Tax=Coptis chinensis TaxID=261450 RepID=A0A835H7N1_9MAGN|nr:hypothetical protein IFM89_020152 [Coptis chinensis]